MRWLSISLAFAVGFVDTAAFVQMGGLFVAHVTGNFVLIGAALAHHPAATGHASIALQGAAFAIFFLSALAAGVFASAMTTGKGVPVKSLVAAGALIMAIAGATALAAPDGAAASMVLVVSMGVFNALHRMTPAMGPPFTVMTGNVTSIALATAHRLGWSRRAPPPPSPGATLALVVAFALGALTGGLLVSRFGLASTLAPTALIALNLFRPLDRSAPT